MNVSNFVRTINIIFIAMTMGMILFVVVAFIALSDGNYFEIPGTKDPFVIIVPVALVAGMGLGNTLFQKLLAPAKDEKKTLQQKISIYTSTSIIRFALTEGPVLIAIVAFVTSGNLFYLIFAAVGILFFLTLRPSPEKIAKDLNLTYDQQEELGIK
jgi:hypothetical protein